MTELLLFVAWHTAIFSAQAQNGQLKPWDELRRKLTGEKESAIPQDWKARKAARKAQIELLQKHRAQRTKGPKRRGL